MLELYCVTLAGVPSMSSLDVPIPFHLNVLHISLIVTLIFATCLVWSNLTQERLLGFMKFPIMLQQTTVASITQSHLSKNAPQFTNKTKNYILPNDEGK